MASKKQVHEIQPEYQPDPQAPENREVQPPPTAEVLITEVLHADGGAYDEGNKKGA